MKDGGELRQLSVKEGFSKENRGRKTEGHPGMTWGEREKGGQVWRGMVKWIWGSFGFFRWRIEENWRSK